MEDAEIVNWVPLPSRGLDVGVGARWRRHHGAAKKIDLRSVVDILLPKKHTN